MGTDVGQTGRFSLFAVSKDRKLSTADTASDPASRVSKHSASRACRPSGSAGPGGTKGLAGTRLETLGEMACPTHIFGGVVAPHIHLAKPETTN
jgi:hypothetical protein